MARIFGVSPYSAARTVVLLDEDVAYRLPSSTLGIPLGTIFEVCDNLRLGLTATISGEFTGLGVVTSIMIAGNPGWVETFEWMGTFFAARP